MSRKNSILSILIILLSFQIQAQTHFFQQDELVERLQSQAENVAPEIAYIQTSKDIYETGEDLWFKVYLLNSQTLIPSLLSKTLYLQLVKEESKKIVWQEKYEIQNGFANGRVYIESALPEGDYILEAFTSNSFFNDSTEFKAIRRIKIKEDISQKPEAILKPEIIKKVQFTTFPEGGNLVSGIYSNVAFKAVNTTGLPIDVAGILFEDSIPLLTFESFHAGMGSLKFIPVIGKKYTVRLTEPSLDSTFLLPEIYPKGISIQLIGRDKESLTFKVTQSTALDPDTIHLRIQCRGIVYGMKSAKLSNVLKIKIPILDLPQGIIEVTLFDRNLIPIAERLVYINKKRKLNITTQLTKDIYPTRGKAILKIAVKDEEGNPVMSNLGVSIFDKIYQNPGDSNNILAHYYLSTQLNGRIYNPSFYFSKSKNTDEALDLLLLTQGWRKYIWNEANLKNTKEVPQKVIFDWVNGELYYPFRKQKIPKEQTFVMAFSPNKDSLNLLIMADSAGRFTVLPDMLKKGENDYVFLKPFGKYRNEPPAKTWDPSKKLPEFSLQIRLNDPFRTINQVASTNEIIYPLPGILFTDSVETSADNIGMIKIKEVVIKGQQINKIRGKYLGTLDSLANLSTKDDYVCEFGVLNCPRHDSNESKTSKPQQGKEYYVIYNYNTPGEYGRRVTYYYPKYSEEDLLKLNNLSRVKAYYGKREFYKPNYDKETTEASIPDFRNTLLWEPSIFTNEKGEATLNFYCSDIYNDFIGRIEGVGGDGLLGSQYFKFTVRKLNLDH